MEATTDRRGNFSNGLLSEFLEADGPLEPENKDTFTIIVVLIRGPLEAVGPLNFENHDNFAFPIVSLKGSRRVLNP